MLREEIAQVTSKATSSHWRKFGWLVGGVALGISALVWWKTGRLSLPLAGAGLLLVLLGWLAPSALRWPYQAWMALAVSLGYVMTRVILSLLFVLVFVPAGLALRLLSKDPLHQRFEPGCQSYWIPRSGGDYHPQDTEKQY